MLRSLLQMILSLPPEIVSLILIRLSVKRLAILKCVNTFFSSFISSPEFVRAHIKFSVEDASMSSYRVIANSTPSCFSFYSVLMQTSIQSLISACGPPRTLVDLDYPRRELERSAELLGSCNGIVFMIVNGNHWFMWNPTTGKHKKLPNIGRHTNICRLNFELRKDPGHNFGFGFDKSNDDYKVVTLFSSKCPDFESKKDACYVVNVYSLKRNSWVRIPDFTCGKLMPGFGKFASGQLHWSTVRGDIVSFDVKKEVFGTLEQPNHPKSGFDVALNVLGESISLSYIYSHHVDVWVMKEYGIKKSWTKMFTISMKINKPLSILPNGDVLLDNGFFDTYNPKDGNIRYIRIIGGPTLIYVESLVSP